MGERLRRLKKGAISSLAAIAMSSGAGFCIPSDYNKAAEEARQAYIYEHQDSDGLYDYDAEMIGNLEEILAHYKNSTMEINTFLTYEVQGGVKSGTYKGIFGGSGLALDSGYILSAAHNIKPEFEEMLFKKTGGVVTSFSVRYFTPIENGYCELEPVWTGVENDFTLLKFKNEPQFSIPAVHFVPGNSSNLVKGSITYSFSALNKPYVKEGNVLNPLYGDEYGGRFRRTEYFFVDTKVKPGDSGGIVIAFLDGKPQIVGIASRYKYTLNEKREIDKIIGGIILKIEHIMEEAGQFFETKER
ncbi:MAG: serine protease [Nanoarchaeota archaeon]|nr:serine protease [Nanoarchaeota archaeon]